MEKNHSESIRISLVIPAYNEETLLPRLLDTVDLARNRFSGGAEAIEVIVANNESTDRTAEIAAIRGCSVVNVAERRIASVRNGGAMMAHGSILTFVDADTQIHPETFDRVESVMASGKVVAGASGVKLERWSLGIAATYVLFVPLLLILRMDTGVVFCRKTDFEQIGGYNQRRYFGEDVQLLWDLRRLGKERRQKLTRLTSVKAVVSTRKFDQYGEWHYFTQLFRLVPMMLRTPEASNDWAQRYWYGDDR